LALGCLPAEVMDMGHLAEGCSQTMGVRERLGQGQRLMAALQGLVRIAQLPQDSTGKAQSVQAQAPSIAGGQSGIPLREGNPLLAVRQSRGELSKLEPHLPQRPMSR